MANPADSVAVVYRISGGDGGTGDGEVNDASSAAASDPVKSALEKAGLTVIGTEDVDKKTRIAVVTSAAALPAPDAVNGGEHVLLVMYVGWADWWASLVVVDRLSIAAYAELWLHTRPNSDACDADLWLP